MDLDLRTRLRRLDQGRPVTLPAPVDHAAEWWGRRGARARRAVIAIGVVLTVLAVGSVGRTAPAPTVDTWIATRSADTGEDIARLVRRDARSRDVLPVGAVIGPDPPTGRLTVPLVEGQALTDRHLASDLTAMVDDDAAVVAVRADQLPPVEPGGVVDVLAVGIDGTGTRLAARVPVLAADEHWLWLGVPEAAAAAIAAADNGGRLSLSRRPPGSSAPPPPTPGGGP